MEGGGAGDPERDLAFNPDEIGGTFRFLRLERKRALECGGPQVGLSCEEACERCNADRSEHEHVGGDERARRDRSNCEQHAEDQGREHDPAYGPPPLVSHTGTRAGSRSSSRTATSAAIASSLISGPGSCWLNFAHSKSAVRRSAASALASRLCNARPMYSNGASDGRRASPMPASTPSMRAYAAM